MCALLYSAAKCGAEHYSIFLHFLAVECITVFCTAVSSSVDSAEAVWPGRPLLAPAPGWQSAYSLHSQLHCTILKDNALHCNEQHCSALHFTALYSAALYYTASHCTAQRCTATQCYALHSTELHCTALCCTALHCAMLCFASLHCTVMCCTTLNSTALHCIIGGWEGGMVFNKPVVARAFLQKKK